MDDTREFLAREYSALWKGFGVEFPVLPWLDAVPPTAGADPPAAPPSAFRIRLQGEGSAPLWFVGECLETPKTHELFSKILEAMRLSSGQYAVGHLEESPGALGWEDYLQAHAPKIIVALGESAAQGILQSTQALSEIRGQFFQLTADTLVLPTYSPAYLLRDTTAKKATWEDMKQVLAVLGA